MINHNVIFFEDIVKPGLCPKPQGVGDCENACSADADCVKDLKCCPNGCGRDCQTRKYSHCDIKHKFKHT